MRKIQRSSWKYFLGILQKNLVRMHVIEATSITVITPLISHIYQLLRQTKFDIIIIF